MRGRSTAGITLAIVALVAVPSGTAYVPGGKPWPGGIIRYYNAAADQAWPVARAVWVWNHSGARVRFVPSTRSDAQLVIEHFPHGRCVGHATGTLGYSPQARIRLPRIDESSSLCNSYSSAHAVAHELGHVLGLTHEARGCALMNPTGSWRGASLCAPAEQWTWRCGLLEEDDVRGAVALYGGRVTATARDCPIYSAMAAPLRLVAAPRPDQFGIGLRFARPEAPLLPAFLAKLAGSRGGWGFASEQNRCPTESTVAQRYRWSVRPGQEVEIIDRSRTQPGSYCYAVWAFDGLGRPSKSPAWSWVRVTEPLR